MGALGLAVEGVGQLAAAPTGEPVEQPQVQLSGRLAAQAALGEHLGEGRVDGGHVATVAIEEEDVGEAVVGERRDGVAQHRDQGAGPQGEAAGKGQVVLRHADRLGRTDQHPVTLAQRPGNRLGAERIGADRAVGAVLLGGTDGQDDARRVCQVGFHLLPGGVLQSHRCSPRWRH